MSHKSTIKLKISDKEALLDSLKLMGVEYSEAKTENGMKTSCSYSNTISDVDIRLEQDHKGSNMKSVGFHKEKDGSYTAVGDFWVIRGAETKDGETINERSFKGALGKRYAYAKALQDLQAQGYICEDSDVDFTQQNFSASFIKF